MNKIRILLADDHPFLRLGLKSRIAVEPDLSVVGEADNGEDAVQAVARLEPDIVVMDLMMPVLSGTEATKRIHTEHPEIRILVLTSFGSSRDLVEALDAGASGALLKDSSMDDFIAALRTIARGERFLSPEISQILRESETTPKLTDRQLEILESAVRGFTDREIAEQFGITQSGAKHHMRSIFAKLGAANRSEAIGIALRKHLLKI